MKRLSYYDLLALIVEYDIKAIKNQLDQLEKQRLEESGYEVVDATNDDIVF